MSNYKAAFEAASADLSAIMSLLGFTSYPGIDPILRAITNLTLAKAQEQVLRQHKTDYMEAAEGTRRALEAEVQALSGQVKALQSDANSWQSGYNKGRHDGTKHRQSEVEQLTRDVEELRATVVVVPERELFTKYLPGAIPQNADEVNAWKEGYNACHDDVVELNDKAVSEGLLRRCEQMLQFYFEYLCDESAEEVDITMAAEARDELRALLGEGKEAGDV